MAKKSAVIAQPPRAPVPATPDDFVQAGQPVPPPPEPKDKLKRLTIDVAPELHQRFKVAATTAGRDMRDVMTSLIESYVAGNR